MFSIADLLKNKIELYATNDVATVAKRTSAEYQKAWAAAVQCFQIRINKDRKREKKPPVQFMAVRQKLIALREIDDMRWFYRQCVAYAAKRDPKTGRYLNTFSKCFWGALKIK